MQNKIDRMGVLLLMSHLIITLVVLSLYAFAMFNGHEDDTLRTILTVIVGYWFGAMGKDAINQRVIKKDNHPVERGETKNE